MTHAQLPSTEAAVAAVRETAAEFGLAVTTSHDIGTDQVSRRTDADFTATTDTGGSLPHDAFIELGGSPAVEVTVHADGDAVITVDGVEFRDLDRDEVPAFLRSLYGGLAHVKGRFFPPGRWLVVPLPGGRTHKELVLGAILSPWTSGRVR